MAYSMKPLGCDPARIKGMSERLIVSHYENNYGGAVKRLNLIEEQLAEIDYASAPVFQVNGLKREQLIAMNSMILHELFFDGLGNESEPAAELRDTLARDVDATAARVLSRITAGDIVLMHDGHDREGKHRRLAAAALPLILRGLRERGLSSVTVSELLGP